MKKPCRPGEKGCVLRGKVRFDEGPALLHEWDDLAGKAVPPPVPEKDEK